MPAPTYEPYHLYSIPPHLLDVLSPQSVRSRLPQATSISAAALDATSETDAPINGEPGSQPAQQQQQQGGNRTCNVCPGASFADVDAQRAHFRSDWHRYNVKLRVSGGQSVSETRFAQLVEGLEDSLSGSASSTEEDDEDSDDAVATLLSRTKANLRTSSRSPSPNSSHRQQQHQSPLVWFHAPPSTQLGIYKAVFAPDATDYLREVRAAQSGHGAQGRTWALFMVAGGHFAGAIVRVSRSDEEVEAERLEEEERAKELDGPAEEGRRKKKSKQRKTRPETEVLRHKTFHRYTTRRKQGGSQSVNDNAKHKAKSAGAQLRRYGEQALRDDIQGLLKEWEEDIADCERVWIRASWSNRRMFMDENGGIFEKGDDRLRGFPFPTRRPTQSELVRCLNELVRVKTTHFTEAELREQDEAYLASLPKPKPKPSAPEPAVVPNKPAVPRPPTLTPEQTALRSTWLRALDMISRGRLDALRGLLGKPGGDAHPLGEGAVDARVPAWMGISTGGDDAEERARERTLLMLAAAAGQAEIVQWLLEEGGADPTLELGSGGAGAEDEPIAEESDEDATASSHEPTAGARRTAYDLARTRDVRDAFRRAAGAMPDRWDWLGAARVPSALTREMEEGRGEKKKARRKGLKDKIKEREAREREREVVVAIAEEPAAPPPSAKKVEEKEGPRKLGGASGSGEATMGLTPEMRAKVERERRARAAEARMKALGGR